MARHHQDVLIGLSGHGKGRSAQSPELRLITALATSHSIPIPAQCMPRRRRPASTPWISGLRTLRYGTWSQLTLFVCFLACLLFLVSLPDLTLAASPAPPPADGPQKPIGLRQPGFDKARKERFKDSRGDSEDRFRASLTQLKDLPDSNTAVAYVVLCHDVDSVRGASELLQALYTSPQRTRFYIHIDLDAPKRAVELLKTVVARFPRQVAVLVPRIKVGWADVTMVDSELSALRAAFDLWNDWGRAIIVSGTAYPIKSACEREQWLRETDPRINLVHYEKLWKICAWGDPGTSEHCKKTRGRCGNPACTNMTMTPDNGVVYKGPQWVMLSRQFVSYVLTGDLPRRWLDFFRAFSEGPDEMYFPTVLMNGPEEFRRWSAVGTPRGTERWDQLAPFIEEESHGTGTSLVPGDAGNVKSAVLPTAGKPSTKPHHRVLRTSALMYTLWNSARRLGCPSYISDAPWGWSPCWLGREDFADLIKSDRQFARKMRAGEGLKNWLAQTWNRTCPLDDPTTLLEEEPDPEGFLEAFRANRTHSREIRHAESVLGPYVYSGMTALTRRLTTYSVLLVLGIMQNVARMLRRAGENRFWVAWWLV